MTDSTQLKLTLSSQMYDFVNSKASKFGMTLSSYVKNLILNDIKNMDYPVYIASDKVEKSYKKSLQERDLAVEVKDVDEILNNL